MARTAKPWFDTQKGEWTAWLNGRRERLAKGKANKNAARLRLAELQLEAAKNPGIDSDKQTVASVIESYLDEVKDGKDKVAPSTFALKKFYLQDLAERHGWRGIANAKPIHLTQWVGKHAEWKSDWTKSTALNIVQRAFNWAVKQKIIATNPFAGVGHNEGHRRRPLTREEFQAILRASVGRGKRRPTPAARFRQILVFLWFTGARPAEAAGLRWENIDFRNCVIELERHKTSRTQSKPKPRVIALSPVVVKLLASIRRRGEGEHVFLTFRNTPWNKNSLALRVRRARNKAGIPAEAKLYGARHAFGTRAIRNGVNLKVLAEMMGHTTTAMTEHYVHLADDHQHLVDAMRVANAPRPSA